MCLRDLVYYVTPDTKINIFECDCIDDPAEEYPELYFGFVGKIPLSLLERRIGFVYVVSNCLEVSLRRW